MKPFHGSYEPADVTFLLKPVSMEPTPVREKEAAIQSGRRHYSEMLSIEKTPDARYMNLFHRACRDNSRRFAQDLACLALTLKQRAPGKEVVLASLARAGTPVGVLLLRALKELGFPACHYSLSIIRDRGIDAVALDHILGAAGHSDKDVVFIDGWTGKGAIATELQSSITAYNQRRGTALDTGLVVVADLAGVADMAATDDDYLIPSAILNAIVSGLVSRTVLSDMYVGPGDFHACVFYEEKRGEDLSRPFVDSISPLVCQALSSGLQPVTWDNQRRVRLKQVSDDFVAWAMERYELNDRNRVKPGIGESTRALLRRVPDKLLVKEPEAKDVEHLVELARTQDVIIEIHPQLPYRAAVIIKSLGGQES